MEQDIPALRIRAKIRRNRLYYNPYVCGNQIGIIMPHRELNQRKLAVRLIGW